MHTRSASFLTPAGLRQPLRATFAAVLLLAFVAVLVLVPARAASPADPKVVPHTTGAPFTAHDVAGFPGTSTTAPFNECPQIGYDKSCGLLISVSNNGETVLQDTNNQASGATPNAGAQMPFDNIDDTLVGIVNQSSKPLFAIQLSGSSTSTPIFGFEGDGICTYATGGSTPMAQAVAAPLAGVGEPPAGFTGDTYCNASQLAGVPTPRVRPERQRLPGSHHELLEHQLRHDDRRRQLRRRPGPRTVDVLLPGGLAGRQSGERPVRLLGGSFRRWHLLL